MRAKELLPSEGYYKLVVISQAESEIREYEELLQKNFTDDDDMEGKIISGQDSVISSVEVLSALGLPEETVTSFREKAQSMSLDKLGKSVSSYHFARFKDLPSKPLAEKEKEIEFAVRLAEGLEIPGLEIVRTILWSTPPGKMEQWLYRYTQNGTVIMEEAEELAQEFHLK